jgi:uncharacterized RDD family membrane protein YckC
MTDPTSPPPEQPGGQPAQPSGAPPGGQPAQPSGPPPGGQPAGAPPTQPGGAYPSFPGGAEDVARASGPSGPRSGFWRRVGAALIDALILAVPSILLVVVLDQTAGQILSTLLGWAYFTYFEGGPTGMTPGKRALGIRVIDFNTGGSIGYGRALLRAIVEIFSGLVLLIGYLWMIWDREKQTWHDKAANSVVVPVEAYPVQR